METGPFDKIKIRINGHARIEISKLIKPRKIRMILSVCRPIH